MVVECRIVWISFSADVLVGRRVVFDGCVGPWHVHWWPKRSGSAFIAAWSSMMKVPEPLPWWPCAYFMAVNRSRVVWRKQSWLFCTASRMVWVRLALWSYVPVVAEIGELGGIWCHPCYIGGDNQCLCTGLCG